MVEDSPHVVNAVAQRYAGADRIGLMPRQQHFYFRNDDVIAPMPVVKNAHAVVQFFVAVNANSHAQAMLR